MESNVINGFLDAFLGVLDAGFGFIAGDIAYVLNALIVISVTLAGAQWALAQEPALAPFFRKVLFVGFFAFLINNWNTLAGAVHASGALLGLRAGGSTLSLENLHDPGRIAGIGAELFGRTAALGQGMNIITDFVTLSVILIAAITVMLGFFVLALQVFTALIAFKLGTLAAFVALPWGVFSGTAWIAERPLGWVVGSAVRLFVLALIASVSMAFVERLPPALTLDAGGALNILLFGLTVMSLAWFGPQLAAEVVAGQPHLSGADSYRGAQGAAGAVAGGAMTVRSMISGSGAGRRAGVRPAAAPRAGAAGVRIDHSKFQPRPRPGTGRR
ncbi:type IV secretion system protein [Hyphomonas sp.]|uniref:type IV secretion system protein n=1 Tax=Hyphomonas sp. TaxID=87 RepID=UPI003919C0A9